MTTEKLLKHLDEEKLNEQRLYNRISAISSIYLVMFEIDLKNDTYTEIKSKNYVDNIINSGPIENCQATLNKVMSNLVNEDTRQSTMEFINFSTLNKRLENKKTITHEFHGAINSQIWARARFIVIDRDEDGKLFHVLWLVESIDADKKEMEKLHKEAEISEAASKAKSTFLANMSHEIRTPINTILGMNELILREANNPLLLEYAQNIKSAGSALLSIVNDILDFSRVEAGKMEIIAQEYELSSLIVDLVNMTKSKAEDKNLTFDLEVDKNIPKELFGDNIRIKQCILNLLTNAIKYTEKGGIRFIISYEKLDEDYIELKVNVSDTGIGIKENDLKKIFSPFDRAEEERNKSIEGSGLGLSIVQNLLKLMGSTLNIKSEYNVGSEFSFSIKQKIVSKETIGNLQEAFKNSLKVEEYKESLHAPKAHILFIDDTQMNLDVVKGLLKKTGIKIDTALSGMAGLRKVCESKYNIIFIDHRMPGMDGIETLETMKTLPENLNKNVPCIALTANAIHGSREMYLKSGFTDYISKPINPSKLEKVIQKYLPKDLIEKVGNDEDLQNDKNEISLELEGIDLKSALTNCGDFELLKNMFAQFHDSINDKSKELDDYLKNNQISDYKIKVHALKSTSRLIGALKLSELAERLEHAADSGNIAYIREKNPTLLENYRTYLDILKDYTELKEKENNKLKEISIQDFKEYLIKIEEYTKAYDYDNLENIQKELEDYSIPLEFSSIYDKIKTCIYNVDFDGLNAMIPFI
ncbi:MAG: response regulator [Treponema sp.]|nr:response regulator [Treponema sp.]